MWDTFSRKPGSIRNGDTADVACDHIRLMADDVKLMADLGVSSYRFSFSWPRVMPAGDGAPARSGLDQYNTLVELLLEHGIEPVPTLFHWDLPQALEDRGGFRNRDIVSWFVDYATVMANEFGDRIHRWATLNEPWCFAYLGHASGEHAPGLRDPASAVVVAHHQLLAHGHAVQAMRASRHGQTMSIGTVLNPAPVNVDESLGVDDARRIDGTLNRWFLDGLLLGKYPLDVLQDLGSMARCVHDGDEAIVGQHLDWLGINYYNDHFYTSRSPAAHRKPSPHVTAPLSSPAPMHRPVTDMNWPLTPLGFESLLVRLRDEYGDKLPPVYITENGAAYTDDFTDDGVDDVRRVDYHDSHLRAVASAIAKGVDIRGYFAWSLLDNFEWAHGFAQRFGLIHVDYDTQVRTPKASAHWYARVCRENQLT